MGSVFPTYNRWNVTIDSAKGTTATDVHGNKYLDFISGIGVCNLGHRHPHVQQAIETQLNKVWHVSNLFEIPIQEETAKLLTENSIENGLAFFCNSGAEANEAAIKLARKYTRKHKIITFHKSFHGRTFGAMSATGQSKIHEGFGPLLNQFVYVPYNDLETLKAEVNEETAAIMVEIVQGEGGVIPGDGEFLKGVQKLCHDHDCLLIIDEVQTGVGRTGKAFAYQHYNLDPDLISSAKGLGNGFPVGALIGKDKLRDAFHAGSHGTTYGGNPLAMAAAKATMEVVFEPSFLRDVTNKGKQFIHELQTNLNDLPNVKEVRGLGLMIGIELVGEAGPYITKLREKGLLAVSAGPNVIRLLPPLIVKEEQLKQAAQMVKETIVQFASHVAQ